MQMPIWVGILIGVLCLAAGAAVAFLIPFVRNNIVKNNAKKIIRDAEIKAEHITKNAHPNWHFWHNKLFPFYKCKIASL